MTISTLIQMAVIRNHGRIIYPARGNWEDCYAYQDGWHILIYKKDRSEKTCHEIAVDDDGNVLEEE